MRKRLVFAAAMLVLAALLFAGVPYGLIWWGQSRLDSETCVTQQEREQTSPPGEGFFQALAALEVASRFPGWGDTATEVAVNASTRCMGAYALRCQTLKNRGWVSAMNALRARRQEALDAAGDRAERQRIVAEFDAQEDALDWQAAVPAEEREAFCSDWTHWRDWLAAAGVRVDVLCPVCGAE